MARELVVALDWSEDGRAGTATVEVVEPEVVREEVRYPALERIELRQRVFAQPEQEVRAETRLADCRGELAGERIALLVEEVLLELVEDDVDLAADGL